MPKRSYPFAESFSSQYKIHIGQKELNLHGVFGNKSRQEVYEKTKGLLFNGTKAVMGRIWKGDADAKCSGLEPGSQSEAIHPTAQMLLKGQTLISLDGKLKKVDAIPEPTGSSAVCGVCRRASGVKRPCEQCERPTCASCAQQCSSCSRHCCSMCTTTDYTDRYDRILCFNCSS